MYLITFLVLISPLFICELPAQEASVVQRRSRIQNWHVRVSHKYFGTQTDVESLPIGSEFYFDGQSKRRDISYHHFDRRQGILGVPYKQFTIWSGGEQISFSSAKYVAGKRDAVSILKEEPLETLIHSDIRGFGMHPEGLKFHRSANSFFEDPDLERLSSEEVQNDGMDCQKVTYQLGPSIVAVWFAPEFEGNPVRFEATGEQQGVPYRLTTTCQYYHVKPSQIWFPSRIVYEEKMAETVAFRQESVIDVILMNGSIDPTVFTLAGINPPIGTAVYQSPESEQLNLIWDGDSVVGEVLQGAKKLPKKRGATIWKSWFMIANALVLSIIAVACFKKFLTIPRNS